MFDGTSAHKIYGYMYIHHKHALLLFYNCVMEQPRRNMQAAQQTERREGAWRVRSLVGAAVEMNQMMSFGPICNRILLHFLKYSSCQKFC